MVYYINPRIVELKRLIEKHTKMIERIQSKCDHNNYPKRYKHVYPEYVTVTYGANLDQYWINCHCAKCDAKFTVFM
jgi:hypothetical protein